MAKGNILGNGLRRFFFRLIGGVVGLFAAAFLLLGPLNSSPQLGFETGSGFLAICLVGFLGWAGMEVGAWAARDAELNDALRRESQEAAHNPAATP